MSELGIQYLASKPLPSTEQIKAELCRRKLHRFVQEAWAQVEPGTPFVDNWHIAAICDHLEAVTRSDIRRLIINMPPRFAKSLLTSVFWPAWVWATAPATKWLTGCYSLELATRDAVSCRRLMESPWYQRRFGSAFGFRADQNQKTRYENTLQGHRVVTSPGSAATGEGGDVLLVDDPISSREGNSDLAKRHAATWWRETMSTRYNNPKTGAAVIVMQRLAEDDLTGVLLREGGWEHLCLPMRYEAKSTVTTSIGFKDPRSSEGELLFPHRFDEKATATLERELQSYGTAGQLQQRPTPRGGGLLKSGWLPRYTQHPRLIRRRIYADTANKIQEHNDWSVFQLWALGDNGKIYLIDQIRDRWEAGPLKRAAIDFWNKHAPSSHLTVPPLSGMLVEDKASGTGLVQQIRAEGRIPVKPVQRSRDKYQRACDAQPYMEAGLVCVPEEAPWLSDFCSEIDKFTKDDSHAFDDQLDPMMDAIQDLLSSANDPMERLRALSQR